MSSTKRFHVGGVERAGLDVGDFWQWTLSNLKDNTSRGFLAEYIVHHAVGGALDVRSVWGNVDVVAADGTRLQVKASAYVQAWKQQAVSKIVFGGLRGRAFDDDTGVYVGEPVYRGDVYVFALQTARDHASYDVLDLSQWRFFCVPQRTLVARNTQTLALSSVRALAAEVDVDGLRTAVTTAAALQRS